MRPASRPAGLHPDRTTGRDRDHRDPDRAPPARGAEGPGGGRPDEMHQQPAPDGPRLSQLPRRERQVPARRLRSAWGDADGDELDLPVEGPEKLLLSVGGTQLDRNDLALR